MASLVSAEFSLYIMLGNKFLSALVSLSLCLSVPLARWLSFFMSLCLHRLSPTLCSEELHVWTTMSVVHTGSCVAVVPSPPAAAAVGASRTDFSYEDIIQTK